MLSLAIDREDHKGTSGKRHANRCRFLRFHGSLLECTKVKTLAQVCTESVQGVVAGGNLHWQLNSGVTASPADHVS